jgi:hypothetical protein
MATALQVTWELRRKVPGSHVYYDRVGDIPVAGKGGGSAAVYDGQDFRTALVAVNGAEYLVPWPDTGAMFAGDTGQPLGVKLKYEPDWGWVLYMYMYSGNSNPHTEWAAVLGVGGL